MQWSHAVVNWQIVDLTCEQNAFLNSQKNDLKIYESCTPGINLTCAVAKQNEMTTRAWIRNDDTQCDRKEKKMMKKKRKTSKISYMMNSKKEYKNFIRREKMPFNNILYLLIFVSFSAACNRHSRGTDQTFRQLNGMRIMKETVFFSHQYALFCMCMCQRHARVSADKVKAFLSGRRFTQPIYNNSTNFILFRRLILFRCSHLTNRK